MCWNDAYLILGLEDQWVGTLHNNLTHISSVAMHVGMVDMHIFFTWPYHMLFDKNYSHVAWQSFIYIK